MPNTRELNERYKSLSDEELLKLGAQGGFTGEAEMVLDNEFARRNLRSDDAKRHRGFSAVVTRTESRLHP